MKILGIYWGMCSTSSLFVDGNIIHAVSEERFTRRKNEDRFPAESIKSCLLSAKIKPSSLNGVAIASMRQPFFDTLIHKYSSFSIQDYIREQKEYWYPKLIEKKEANLYAVFADRVDKAQYPTNYWDTALSRSGTGFDIDREGIVADFLGGVEIPVQRIEHHRSHAAYGYYMSPFRNDTALVFTIDGWGDGLNATINIFEPGKEVQRVFSTTTANIGRIYRYMTLLLGMKPNEHEYKIMGLAPYGKGSIVENAYRVFVETLYVDGLDFKWKQQPTDSYFWFRDRLEGCRFDGIAAGLQQWTEELLCQWVKNAVSHFGIGTVVLSGGVAMNVKAMGKIASLPEVKRFFVAGTGSDESLALGATFCLAEDLAGGKEKLTGGKENSCSLYLGSWNTSEEEQAFLRGVRNDPAYEVVDKTTFEFIAELLAAPPLGRGLVLGRCAGAMEFGQRALGNRSIIADPINPAVVPRINQMIKNRDFWMPFAPVVLDSYSEKYLINPKRITSPHMTVGFETTSEGWKAMPAACHPADHTARAQILYHQDNPALYGLLQAFAEKTGRGAILNTSFNLHGYPIVNTIADGWDVFTKSGLDGLLLADSLVLKKRTQASGFEV